MNFTELMIFIFMVRPGVEHFFKQMKEGRMSSKRGYTLAFIFFAGFALICNGWSLWTEPANAYQLLDVRTTATRSQINKAFKRKSLVLHPDKNPSEEAKIMFEKVRQAHELLTDAEVRTIYDRFGESVATNPQAGEFVRSGLQLSMHIGVYYLISAAVTFLFTLGKTQGKARSWSFLLLFIVFTMEVLLKLGEYRFLDDFLPTYTIYQQVDFLHSLYLYLFQGIGLLASHLYVDYEMIKVELLREILDTQRELMDRMDAIDARTGGMAPTGPSHVVKDKLPPNAHKKVRKLQEKASGGFNWGTAIFVALMAYNFFAR